VLIWICRLPEPIPNPFPMRSQELINKVAETIDLGGCDVLCVGCRNFHELNYFKDKGAKKVVGIDLYSEHSDISIMDMHAMTFADSSFDLVYSSHSLEHALDTAKVVSELVRVVRDGGFIVVEVPVNYQTGGADLVDFVSLENLHNFFEDNLQEILWSESVSSPDNERGHSTAIRTIIEIRKNNSWSPVKKRE
jgi:SAM-dependent methyltransferase